MWITDGRQRKNPGGKRWFYGLLGATPSWAGCEPDVAASALNAMDPIACSPSTWTADARVVTRVDDFPVAAAHVFGSARHGAELCFRGVVRGTEVGESIRGIRYSAYLPMARATLEALAHEVGAGHPDALIYIHHRLGEVAAGEASLLLAVATPHSAEALAVLETLLRRLKAEVPIWKQPLLVGDR